MHKLVVRGNEGRIKFLDIGATSKLKLSKLKEIEKVVRVKEYENIPHPSLLIEIIRKNLPYKKYRNKDYYVYKTGNATKHSLNVLYNVALGNNLLSPIVKKEFDLLSREDIGWEKVESIEDKGEQELYDFTVDKDSFSGSPYFLLHNSKFYGESEKKIRDIFEEAEKSAPSIIFIDELDAVAPKREEVMGEVERRVVSQMLTMMDGLKSRGKVIVIGATNRVNAIDPALRRPGRFDREIEISVPGKQGRESILKIHTRGMPIHKNVNIKELASVTHGFVGADLESFKRMGIRPSRGILLYGPPGTGKTLLAKAVAKESEANFIQVKGPSLLSMWVGKSEEGIRKIFERARQVAPCIIFFDEIDSLAGKRGLDSGAKVTERVLNQLLAEMDGIVDLKSVVVIGATNRPDLLDSAVLRPGRFDRILLVDVPDKESRKQIVEIHTKNMPLDKDIKIETLVKKTEGFVGADIENLVREAAIIALRKNINADKVTMNDFEEALKRVKPSVNKPAIEIYKKIEENFLKSAKATMPIANSY